MIRRRPYHRWPREIEGWFDEQRLAFCDASNPHYRRDMRMISWRRP